jgi:hypothetical protein
MLTEQSVLSRKIQLRRDAAYRFSIKNPTFTHRDTESPRQTVCRITTRSVIRDKKQRSSRADPLGKHITFTIGESRLRDVTAKYRLQIACIGDNEDTDACEISCLERNL